MEFWMNLVLSDWMYLWLAVIVITAVIEIITVGLTSIWISGGALAALIVCLCGGHPGLQIAVFFVVTPLVFYKTMGKKVSGESKGCDQLRGVHRQGSACHRGSRQSQGKRKSPL